MTRRVISTPPSRKTLRVIYNYINQNFGTSSADKFLAKVDKTTALIAKQPYMFKSSKIDEDVRVGFITKQCSLFYWVTETEIHLLFFLG